MGAKVIAIDGPAASGKSTIASRVSDILDIPYINTGNMYRSVTYFAQQNGVDPCNDDPSRVVELLDRLDLDYRKTPDGHYEIFINGSEAGNAIRSPEVTACVSQVSAIPEVREWLLGKQRKFAALGTIVMEGRDIGSVVFPDAEYKFFLTATPEARARRRLAQDGETSANSTVQSVAAQIAERDRIDSTRKVAPLLQADDAVLVDSTNLTISQVVEHIIDRVRNESDRD